MNAPVSGAYPAPAGGCAGTAGVIICRPRYYAYRHLIACPTCDHKRRAVSRWEMWYGLTTYCLTCGESWEDGDLRERPFRRGWREESIKYARTLYAEAMSRREFGKARDAYLADYFADAGEFASGDSGASE